MITQKHTLYAGPHGTGRCLILLSGGGLRN